LIGHITVGIFSLHHFITKKDRQQNGEEKKDRQENSKTKTTDKNMVRRKKHTIKW
jgi:hypothetical protein